MQSQTIEKKKFSRSSAKLVKHTFNGFVFLTVGNYELDNKMKALAVTLRDDPYFDPSKSESYPIICGSTEFEIWDTIEEYETQENGYQSYRVLTDSQADWEWDMALDIYLDDCILHELDGTAKMYFDTEKWKRDARMDGRGHSLNSYDGTEECATINKVDYYIYRTN
jgi:hypothetical protein